MAVYGISMGDPVILHQDALTKTKCIRYESQGSDICGDVIDIPVNNTSPFQYVKITTPNYLTLCEVEVFAGMTILLTLLIYMQMKQLFICHSQNASGNKTYSFLYVGVSVFKAGFFSKRLFDYILPSCNVF